MGRHSSNPAARSMPKIVMPLVASAAAIALIAGGGAFVVKSGVFAAIGEQAAVGGGGECADGRTELSVIAAPSIAGVLDDIASAYDEAGCTDTEVTAQGSADTAAVFAAGGEVPADVWVPDGSVWVDRMNSIATSLGRDAVAVEVGSPVASSPVVFAAPAARAGDFGDVSLSWASVLGADLPALLPDPESSAASLAGLTALSAHTDQSDPRPFNAAMIALGKSIPASPEAAFGSVFAAAEPTVAIASEQEVVEFNGDENTDQLVAVFPTDGTVSVSYPFVRVGDVAADGDRAAAVSGLEQALRGAADRLTEAGFRDGEGNGVVSAPGVLATSKPAPAVEDGAAQLGILRAWGVLTLRSRLLAVIDVSGSMEEPASNGLRRIDVFQQAAMGAVSKFSGEVELGVWLFSTGRNGDLDYEDVVPIAPLADSAHTQQIGALVQSLPSRLGGGTGLYDTTYAAVQRVRESYDPTKINAVLLITDGKNEDDTDGLSLEQLLADLQQLQADDPTKQVPVIMIGFGPDTDMDAMTQIAKSTGGAAYLAEQPEDLGTVLVDALSQRTCRPDCG
ncbi:substrate-binding domain-containing protein [Agromyces seonyuensis]|uniref:Solute-binding protein n=1 Tax=Agromyces seonyuensis TaxID=2662446 RepID=A0A6I4NV79_9MICO|nr:substrate-binding domain-containing protein [Agromyces seonyuensis]MWB98153.1 solute-binding protein [Agromyces seonyuensis]